MADGQHSRTDGGVPAVGPETARLASLEVSRRTLLGAAFAPMALSRHPGVDPGSILLFRTSEQDRWIPDQVRDDESGQSSAVTKWDRALARFAAAEAAIAAAAGAPDPIYDPIGARHSAALARLLRTPAPSLAALARKLDLALDERTVAFFGDKAAMKALKQDARRLAASAA
jgi:hypothetical protein